MESSHVLVVPYPAQGHVIILMELTRRLVDLGFRVTFVNSDFNHRRVVTAGLLSDEKIRLVSIPDGLEPWEDRNDLGRLSQGITRAMPEELERLIFESGSEGRRITCVIADVAMAWAIEVAEKMKVPRTAAFWSMSAMTMVSGLSVEKLITDGIIDKDGALLKRGVIHLRPDMPAVKAEHLSWTCMGDTGKLLFKDMNTYNKIVQRAEWLICNSSAELEPGAFGCAPHIRPIGPLLASNSLRTTAGYFWLSEDVECLNWLDDQPPRSVIYVAFGSFTIFDPTQFEELSQGIEMTDRPFLWVVRPDNASSARMPVSSKGKVVGWAPQQKVLGHPSVVCFMSHCGWNSTMEGVSNGVPFLCWPYFADQFYNESYICDVWKVGLRLEPDEGGIVRRDEIKTKVDTVLGDEDGFRKKALEIKEKVINGVKHGGDSYDNFNNFVDWMKSEKH